MDIAGLVKGASKGEGLGNKFLSHVREVDTIIHLTRCFDSEKIQNVNKNVNPVRDLEIIETEILLSDLDSLQKRLEKSKKKKIRKRRAKLFRRMGETKLEIKSLQKAVKLDPKDADTWVKLALYEKDDKKAIILLKRALKQNPISKEVIFEQLFWRYRSLKKFSEAINIMRKYEDVVRNGRGFGYIGDTYGEWAVNHATHDKKIRQALEAYDKGLRQNPKDVEIFTSKILGTYYY